MFALKKRKSGGFIKYAFHHAVSGSGFVLVPELGAVLTDLYFGGKPVIDGYKKAAELKSLAWAKSALLAPFPNRLKDGVYKFEGESYQFPINEKNTDTAIHGFAMAKKMKVETWSCEENEATVICVYKDSGRRKAYPFPHHFRVCYQMKQNAFSIKMSFKNTGKTPLPVGLGWHPYFQLGKDIDAHKLKLPKDFLLKKIEIDDQMIPTGKQTSFLDFQRSTNIGDAVLDNCFLIQKNNPKATRFEIQLSYEKQKLTYWQKLNEGHDYVQLFTPPNRNSLAIEPMSCNIDAFNNGNGLTVLQPEETLDLECGLRYR